MSAHDELSPSHPVREAQARIAKAFSEPSRKSLSRNDLAAALPPLLEALGWRGKPRHIFEALPHLTSVDSALAFRAVLDRVGVLTRPIACEAAEIDSELLPLLIVPEPGVILVALRREADGDWLIFDSRTGQSTALRPESLKGSVYFVRIRPKETQADQIQHIGILRGAMRRLKPQINGIIGLSLLTSVVGLSIPLYMMVIYDRIVATRSLDTLLFFAIGMIGVIMLDAHLRHKRARLVGWVIARFDAHIAVSAFRSVVSLPLSMTEASPISTQVSRFRQFAVGRELFRGPIASSLIELPVTLLFFGMVFMLGGALGWVPVALATSLLLLGLITNPGADVLSREMGEARVLSDSLLLEASAGRDSIRHDHAEAIWRSRLSSAYAAYLVTRFESQTLSRSVHSIAQVLVSIAGVGILLLGALRVMDGTMSTGALVGIMGVVWRVLGPIQVVCLSLHRIAAIGRSLKQIDQLLRLKPERSQGSVPVFERHFKGALSLANVTMRHASKQDFALRGVSLKIEPGSFVAIAGPSGAGKSTLLRTMQGLYQPQGGVIRLDGFDLRQLDCAEVRQTMRLFEQHVGLFYGTIAQNIRLAAPDASDAEILTMLDSLGVSFPNPIFPEGLDTRLSASVRAQITPALEQRISIARTLIRPGAVLLLDQPEAHLDAEGNRALMAHLEALRGTITIVLVSSHPEHLQAADRLIIMNEGQIVASGPPSEVYASLNGVQNHAA